MLIGILRLQQEHDPDLPRRIPRESLPNGDEILERLGHLEPFDVEVAKVPKVIHPLSAAMRGLRLAQLVVVVRKLQVVPTCMYLPRLQTSDRTRLAPYLLMNAAGGVRVVCELRVVQGIMGRACAGMRVGWGFCSVQVGAQCCPSTHNGVTDPSCVTNSPCRRGGLAWGGHKLWRTREVSEMRARCAPAYIHIGAHEIRRHHRAFNVPTGTPSSPWRRPRRLASLGLLPQGEVSGVTLLPLDRLVCTCTVPKVNH